MNLELTIGVQAPEDELFAVNECYALYKRSLSIDFVPQIGTHISLKTDLLSDDQRFSLYENLVSSIDNKALQLVIEEVNLAVDPEDRTEVKLRSRDLFESSLQKFRNLGELLVTFYGFDRVV